MRSFQLPFMPNNCRDKVSDYHISQIQFSFFDSAERMSACLFSIIVLEDDNCP